jgi:hypothetical protein
MSGRRSGFRTRFGETAAAVGVVAALASGLTGALVASPAAALPAPKGTSCKGFTSNTASGTTATLVKCSDHKDTGGGGTATTTQGTPNVITWNNGQTTTLGTASNASLGQGVCPAGQIEFHQTEPVTASTTPSITVGMTLDVFYCFGGSVGSETIAPGTVLTISSP